MSRLKFAVLLFAVVCCSLQAQPVWQWAKSGASASSDNGISVCTDNSGNVIATGYFYNNTIAFGSYTLANNGNYDCFVVKYDPNGNVLWAKSLGGAFDDVGNGIATDAAGNIFITGYFLSSSVTVGTNTLNNMGGSDAFVVKYDALGNVSWVKSFGGSMNEQGNSIATDPSGNIFVAGDFSSAIWNFGIYTITNGGGSDIFIGKINNAGVEQWCYDSGGNLNDIAYGICTDNLGNSYITGAYRSASCSMGPFTLNNSGTLNDIFIAKYDSLGTILWANNAGGSQDDIAYGITADQSGHFYLTGYFKSPSALFGAITVTNTGASTTDVFTAKYDTSGAEIWVQAAGGNFDDLGYSIAVDAGGIIYTTGHIHSSAISFGSYTLNCAGVGDAFLVKYDPSGNALWATNIGSVSDDGTSSVAVDPNSNAIVTGFFYSPSINLGSHTLNNVASADVFVAKLSSTNGLAEINSIQNTVLLYPNPSSGIFYIKSEYEFSEIEIYDALGSEVLITSGTYFDLSNKSKGIYFVHLKNKDHVFISKIILH